MNQKDDEKSFNEIKGELISEIQGMREDMKRLFETVQFHDQSLYGDKKTFPGIIADVRGMKEQNAKREKHINWVWMAVIAGAVERAFHYVTGR